MQKLLFQAWEYLNYRKNAIGRYGIHSPFVFALYEQVIMKSVRESGTTRWIEEFRNELESETKMIPVEDYGAGASGRKNSGQSRSISSIAKSAARHPKFGRLLHQLCLNIQPQCCLELGTNLGISALYQRSALTDSRFVSIEGSPAIAERAKAHLEKFGMSAEIITGEFTTALEQLNWDDFKPDYVFIDGNHRKDPTLEYFRFLIEKSAPECLYIFDDIHWSEGMREAWDEIRKNEAISVSIDLFGMGLCFTGRDQAKEHFVLKY